MLTESEYAFNIFRIECCVVWLFSCCLFLATWMGVWLANSEKTFATRLAIVLAAPVFLILGKASEICWGWVLISLTVATGYWLIHRKCLRPKSDLNETRSVYFRFSIRSLLYSMLVVSWFLFAYLHSSYLDLLAWRSIIAIAILFSLFAIGIHAVVFATRGLTFIRSVTIRIAMALLLMLVIPLAWMDDLLPSFLDDFSDWPPVAASALFVGSPDRFRMLWFAVGAVFYSLSIFIPSASIWSISSQRARIVTMLLLLIVGAFPIWVGSNMTLPIKRVAVRHDFNAYRDLVSIGQECENSIFAQTLVTYSEWEKVPAEEQELVLNETKSLLAALRESLQKPVWIPLVYSMDDIDVVSFSALRALSRLTIAHGTSQLNLRDSESTDTILVCAKMGAILQRGGMMIHSLVGIAIGSQAIGWFKVHITQLSPNDRSRILDELKRLLDEIESADVIRSRDIAWSSTISWVTHARAIVDRTLGVKRENHGFEPAFHRHLAEWRMLIIELLLENHRERTGLYPPDLMLLSADRPEIIQDPFALKQSFKYRTSATGFLLYSVGENGIDDGGDYQPRPGLILGRDLSLAGRLVDPESN